jgi:adenylyltransferase/sulfurtransferase
MLLPQEEERYQKHLLLPKFGLEAQLKLKNASVLVVGAGGLGSPVLLYLSAAGVGKLGIIDPDDVALSNLQRQVLYHTDEIGLPKAPTAVGNLRKLNDQISYSFYTQALKRDNALSIITHYDVVVDCTDNFTVRYVINDACVHLGKPFVYGAIHQFEGQVSVFNHRRADGLLGPTYRCLFPEQPTDFEIPNCAEIGVLGILPGTIGLMQANEVVKLLTGVGQVLSGELLMMDLFENTHHKIKLRRRPDAETLAANGMANTTPTPTTPTMKMLSATELKQRLDGQEDIFLLDVRNLYEYEICRLDQAVLIPMNTIPNNVKRIPTDRPVVVYCHHGMRSASVIQFLEQNHDLPNLYNLSGGIEAWARDVDTSMERY